MPQPYFHTGSRRSSAMASWPTMSIAAWHRSLIRFVLAFGLMAIVGCSSTPEPPPPDLPPEELYTQGQNLLDAGNYKEAAKSFEEVERQHPYSQWATRGQI